MHNAAYDPLAFLLGSVEHLRPPIPPDVASFPPPAWNSQYDACFLLGDGGQPSAHLLYERGARRIVVYLPHGSASGYPEGTKIVRTLHELSQAIKSWKADPPGHYLIQPFEELPDLQKACMGIKQEIDCANINVNVVAQFADTWRRNGIANLPAMAKLAHAGDLRWERKPCVIVGPGPSLTKNKHLLREVKEKGTAIIAALPHAVAPISDVCAPDIVVCCDSQEAEMDHFIGMDMAKVRALVLSATVDPKLYALPTQYKFSFLSNYPMDQWIQDVLGETQFVPGAGSVTSTLVSFAVAKWNCNPIIMIGQDLAFKDYGQGQMEQYAEGFSEALEATPVKDWQMTPGFYGEPVFTSSWYLHVLLWLSGFPEACMGTKEKPGPRYGWKFINATEGGASIPNWQQMSFSEALSQFCTRKIDIDGELWRVKNTANHIRERQILKRMRKAGLS